LHKRWGENKKPQQVLKYVRDYGILNLQYAIVEKYLFPTPQQMMFLKKKRCRTRMYLEEDLKRTCF